MPTRYAKVTARDDPRYDKSGVVLSINKSKVVLLIEQVPYHYALNEVELLAQEKPHASKDTE
jgi:hypothetical protein